MNREVLSSVSGLRLGAFLKVPAMEVTEIFADAGYDHVVLDLEHSPMSLSEASRSIGVGRARGINVLVRVPSHDPFWFQRCLDSGAAGIVVPHVDTGEQAKRVMAAARFPPNGTRGVGPTSRQGKWGSSSIAEYMDSGQRQCVIVQIESKEAIDSIEEILAAGVDGILVGPADLSVEMGVAPGSSELTDARDTVMRASRSAGVPCGIAAGSAQAARSMHDLGFDFTVVGNDLTVLYTGAVANNPFYQPTLSTAVRR